MDYYDSGWKSITAFDGLFFVYTTKTWSPTNIDTLYITNETYWGVDPWLDNASYSTVRGMAAAALVTTFQNYGNHYVWFWRPSTSIYDKGRIIRRWNFA